MLYRVDWTSDANGECELLLDGRNGTPQLSGLLDRLVTFSGAERAPEADYDVYVRDMAGNDLLSGAGENRPVSLKVTWMALADDVVVDLAVHEAVRLVIANAGPSRDGTIGIYLLGTEQRQCAIRS